MLKKKTYDRNSLKNLADLAVVDIYVMRSAAWIVADADTPRAGGDWAAWDAHFRFPSYCIMFWDGDGKPKLNQPGGATPEYDAARAKHDAHFAPPAAGTVARSDYPI